MEININKDFWVQVKRHYIERLDKSDFFICNCSDLFKYCFEYRDGNYLRALIIEKAKAFLRFSSYKEIELGYYSLFSNSINNSIISDSDLRILFLDFCIENSK